VLPERIPTEVGPLGRERARQIGLSLAAFFYRPIFDLLTRVLERVEAGELDWLLDFLSPRDPEGNAKEPK